MSANLWHTAVLGISYCHPLYRHCCEYGSLSSCSWRQGNLLMAVYTWQVKCTLEDHKTWYSVWWLFTPHKAWTISFCLLLSTILQKGRSFWFRSHLPLFLNLMLYRTTNILPGQWPKHWNRKHHITFNVYSRNEISFCFHQNGQKVFVIK